MQSSRSGARREERGRLDQIEERLLAPLDVVETDDERRLLLDQLAECPSDLVRARRLICLAEQRAGAQRQRRGRTAARRSA